MVSLCFGSRIDGRDGRFLLWMSMSPDLGKDLVCEAVTRMCSSFKLRLTVASINAKRQQLT
jgi:hypothetical protein